MSRLSFGYLYDFRNPAQWRRPWAQVYADILDFAAWSEDAGFEGAWVSEHHGTDDGYMPSPLVALAAIAVRTRTIRLGAAVALAPLYHPVRFAEDCAVLDNLSGGRLEMTVALGYRRRETDAYGVDFSRRGSRTDEFLDVVTRLWAGETVDLDGEHFTLRSAAISPVPDRGRIPLHLGGFTRRALRRAARFGDGYFGNVEIVELFHDELRRVGRDPGDVAIRIQGLFDVVAKNPEQAMAELAPYFLHVNNSYGQWHDEDRAATGLDAATALEPMTLDDFVASGTLRIHTPEEAVAMFTAMLEKAPVEHFTMMLPPGLPPARFTEYAQVFATEVIPAFR